MEVQYFTGVLMYYLVKENMLLNKVSWAMIVEYVIKDGIVFIHKVA